MKNLIVKILLLFFLIALVFAFKTFDLEQYLTLSYLKENQQVFQDYYREHRLFTAAIYIGIYVVVTALSLPGAVILTLAGGALFGFLTGVLLVSFASTVGATLAFLAARFLLRDWVRRRFQQKIAIIDEGVQKEGGLYLFTLRLIPLFPFFLINLVMGLTPIRTSTFFFVSQIGMLAGTMVYVNAGVQIGNIDSLRGILSFNLLFAFVLLGILPLIAKKIINGLKKIKIYKGYKKPSKFDYNMAVIGAGSAGLVTAYICSAVKAKVALIERHKMGGDCLNTGCVPSKALIKSAKVVWQCRDAAKYGIDKMDIQFDFAKIMDRVKKVIAKIEPHDSIGRYTDLGVDCLTGEAKFLSPWEIQIGGKSITAKNITIATGASPFIPPIKNIEKVDYLTSDTLWDLRQLPKKFVVLGGGPIGLEMAQCFQRFGSKVSVVEMSSRVMINEDPDVSQFVEEKLKKEGVEILTNHQAFEFKNNVLICKSKGREVSVPFDKILIAVGRKANIKGFDPLKIALRKNNTVDANSWMQTNYPNIYVCGDVTGPYQLTHAAGHQAWYCAVNALFSPLKKFKVDYRVIPWCTYTDPEVASVGLNEEEAKRKNIPCEVTKYGIDDLDRAITDSDDYGFVKILTVPGKDKILGATVVGASAGELITEFVNAMKNNYGLNRILGTIHTYPTLSEANKYAAGVWKKKQVSPTLLGYLQKFHKWRLNR